jgi:hypothetical protein
LPALIVMPTSLIWLAGRSGAAPQLKVLALRGRNAAHCSETESAERRSKFHPPPTPCCRAISGRWALSACTADREAQNIRTTQQGCYRRRTVQADQRLIT